MSSILAKRIWRVSVLATTLILMAMAPGLGLGGSPASSGSPQPAATCSPGGYFIQQYANGFTWAAALPPDAASWTGYLNLYEDLDSNCYVTGIDLVLTGPTNGGSLALAGNVFLSATIQYPSAFSDYANVASNAVGNLTDLAPGAGSYPAVLPTYTIQPHYDINAVGADEYFVQDLGPSSLVGGLRVTFSVPVNLLGQTVQFQMHVGDNLCTCGVTSVFLPGQSPPPPPPPPPPSTTWGVYIHAHQDDWQLFESRDAYHDYLAGDNLLIVYVTAGDAGQGAAYWQPREQAADASVIALAGSGSQGMSGNVTACYGASPQVCHTVSTWTYARVVSVFMRLPDGGVLGGGFGSNNFQSLEKLRNGTISSLSAVDGSTTYSSWSDLYQTIAAIVQVYAPSSASTVVHAPDFDRSRQTAQGSICPGCGDHADHLAVADLVYNATVGLGAPWTRAFYIDYPLGFADPRYPVNLNANDTAVKQELFMAYNNEFANLTGHNDYNSQPWFYNNCFQREYPRQV